MKKHFAICIIVMFCLISCQPSEQSIQTAIAETQGSVTQIIEPTITSTPIPSETPSPSPTPDVRVFDIDPRNLLLEKDDLPINGSYFLPDAGWISPVRNFEIVSSWTVEEGQEYLAETGRIDGWLVYYKRGKSGELLPEQIGDNVVIFSSIEGARTLIEKFSDRRVSEEDYKEIETPIIGDISRTFIKEEVNSSGEKRVTLLLSFSYRNISHSLVIFGWEKEVSMAIIEDIAKNLIAKLDELPLSNSVTFNP